MSTPMHDPVNPDNCPPKCRVCAKLTRDERRGPRVAAVNAVVATKPSWWTLTLACGHVVDVQKSGHNPPTGAHCSDPRCPGTAPVAA